jgi:hypothetical protein
MWFVAYNAFMSQKNIITIRLPKEIMERVDKSSKDNVRSMSQEIEFLIRFAYEFIDEGQVPLLHRRMAQRVNPPKVIKKKVEKELSKS